MPPITAPNSPPTPENRSIVELSAAPSIVEAPLKEASPQLSIDDLLARIRQGDREAAAEFLMRYGSRIRRRIRGKLGPAVRRIFDSMDILSTLGRRLDLYVMSGRLNVVHEEELWSLLFKMADHALVDKARLARNAQTFESQDSEFTYQTTSRRKDLEDSRREASDLEIDLCLHMLPQDSDRRLLSMWLIGESSEAIGRNLGISADTARKRLERIRHMLQERFATASA